MKNIFLAIAILTTFSAYTQQIQLSALYPYNTFLINPAEAGLKKGTRIHLGHRQQWLGFEGSPETTYLTGQHQLNTKMGVGGSFSYDKLAFIQRINGNLSYSYKLLINNDNKVRFGVSAGVTQGSLDLSGVMADDMGDIVLSTATTMKMSFDATFGMTYTYKKDLTVGISLPQLLGTKADLSIEGEKYNLVRHSNIYASYKLKIDDMFEVTPVILLRSAQKKNSQVELFGNIKYDNKYWGGIGFRTNNMFVINAGMQIIDKVGFTYAYEFNSNGIGANTSGTHELMLSINLNKEPEVPEGDVPVEEPTERKATNNRF